MSYDLYLCEAEAIDYTPRGVYPATSEEDAVQKFEEELSKADVWYSGCVTAQIIKIAGFDIQVNKLEEGN